jgi:alpha-mannosidase
VITPFASIRFNKAGYITSMLDKASGRELVKKGGMLAYFMAGENVPLYWDNWDVNPDQHLKMGIQGHLLSRVVVASGPLQLRIRSSWKVGTNSTLTQDMVFHSTTPRVDFETLVDWNETHQLLKACFDLNILADSARHEIQFGHVERPTHFNQPDDRARFEVCAHKWTDLSENGFGAALLNDCKYGVSVLGTTIGLTLMKAGMNPDPRGDKGRHVMTYALMPHNTPFSVESVVRPAYEMNVPLLTRVVDASTQGFSAPALVDAPNVIIEAIKWAEGGGGFVLRLYEAGKTAVKARVSFAAPVREVHETTHLEEQPRKLRVRDGTVDLDFRAFEIKTLLCKI